MGAASADDIAVSFRGKVVDPQGQGIASAKVELLESSLSAVADAQGVFVLSGSVPNGVIRRVAVPGGARLDVHSGRLRLRNPGAAVRMSFAAPDGRARVLTLGRGDTDLEGLLGPAAGLYFIRVESASGASVFRYGRLAAGGGVLLAGRGPVAVARGAARVTASDPQRFVLKVSAAGFLEKRFARLAPTDSGMSLALLPAAATLKERIQDFIGAGRTFRLAFLKKAGSPLKPVLHYVDFAEMAGDTMPQHAFMDSHLDNESVEAFGPSWSPDGRFIAYEAGRESQTAPNCRVYIQPIQGARIAGPATPATNPRWYADGKDTSLVWCSSGALRGWADTTGSTWKQAFSGGQLVGQKQALTKGSYNGGLAPGGRYLAAAFPWAVMLDLQASERRYLHVYPGHAPSKPASDSLQACNASVSQDPAFPSRMLFLDFGVPDGEPAFGNLVRPEHYAQHRMILIGDFLSTRAGRIVDFIDTPESELAKGNTWDDPEWSNLPDFAVASTRDPDGDTTDPLTPRQTQPDIHLIKLSTGESVKIFTGVNQTLPTIWISTGP